MGENELKNLEARIQAGNALDNANQNNPFVQRHAQQLQPVQRPQPPPKPRGKKRKHDAKPAKQAKAKKKSKKSQRCVSLMKKTDVKKLDKKWQKDYKAHHIQFTIYTLNEGDYKRILKKTKKIAKKVVHNVW